MPAIALTDLDVQLRLAHHVGTPAAPITSGVPQQQTGLPLPRIERREAHEISRPLLAQRAQAVGEAIPTDRIEHSSTPPRRAL